MAAARRPPSRADLGKPIDSFFAKQPPALAPITNALRALIEQAAPEATASLKWGMPFWELDGRVIAAVGAFKKHVNLLLPGQPGTYPDPDELLAGDGKMGRRLVLRARADVNARQIAAWLKISVATPRR